jgi:hypothetical protein
MAALARSALRYSARHEAAASDSFADHVIAGLGDSPKWLSGYDAAGSDLFGRSRSGISDPHRAEDPARECAPWRPFRSPPRWSSSAPARAGSHPIEAAPQIAAYAGRHLVRIFGAGGSRRPPRRSGIAVLPVVADFTRDFELPPQLRAPRVGFFPGSTIGNFRARGRGEFCARPGVLGAATMIVGVDRIKDEAVLNAAMTTRSGRDGAVQSQHPGA